MCEDNWNELKNYLERVKEQGNSEVIEQASEAINASYNYWPTPTKIRLYSIIAQQTFNMPSMALVSIAVIREKVDIFGLLLTMKCDLNPKNSPYPLELCFTEFF